MDILTGAERFGKLLSTKKRVFCLSLVMITVCVVVIVIMASKVYRHEIKEELEILQATAQSQARLIEAVASYNADKTNILRQIKPDYEASSATLSQITNAHNQLEGFGETGEFTLAQRSGDSIDFILRPRNMTDDYSLTVAFNSDLAEPMRRALNGSSGTMVGPDYRGVMVLAAYESVVGMNLGVVAKIDLDEVRAPHIISAVSAATVALFCVFAGTVLFFRIGNPIIVRSEAYSRELENEIEERKQAEKLAENFNHVLETSLNEIYIFNAETYNFIQVNRGARENLGYTMEELSIITPVAIKPECSIKSFEKLIEPLRSGAQQKIEVTTIHQRKDGTQYPVEIHLQLMTTETPVFLAFVLDITKRKFAEGALIESESRIERMIQASPVGMLITELQADGTVVLLDVNQATEIIFEKPLNKETGQELYQLLPELCHSDFPEMLSRVQQGNELWEPLRVELNIANLTVLDILMFNSGANLVACKLYDVTDQYFKEKEDIAKQERDDFLNEVSSNLVDITFGADTIKSFCFDTLLTLGQISATDGCFIYLPGEEDNEFHCLTSWYKPEYTKNLQVVENVSLKEFPWVMNQVDSGNMIVINNVEQLPPEANNEMNVWLGREVKSLLMVPLIMHDGNYAFFAMETKAEIRIWEEKDKDLLQKVANLLLQALEREAFAVDRQISENQYRLLNQEFQTILTGIGDQISLWDADKTLVWCNTPLLSEAENIAPYFKHCFENPDEIDCCELCLLEQCYKSNEKQESILRRGDTVWGLKVFPVRDEQQNISRIICLASDITEKIQMREAVERTSRLASLGQIAAGVAHEINNPNALVLMNGAILQEVFVNIYPLLEAKHEKEGDFSLGKMTYSRLRDNLPRMVSDIETSAGRIRSIVNDLRGFVTRGEMIAEEGLDLNMIVKAAIALIIAPDGISKENIQLNLDDNILSVSGSFRRLEQVVMNLVGNALQSLQNPGCQVYVSTLYNSTSSTVNLVIRDEGAGIAPEQLKLITDPFFTTKRNSGGTGLGLSVTADIVKSHDGLLLFDSVLGEGTTVTVKFPVSNMT